MHVHISWGIELQTSYEELLSDVRMISTVHAQTEDTLLYCWLLAGKQSDVLLVCIVKWIKKKPEDRTNAGTTRNPENTKTCGCLFWTAIGIDKVNRFLLKWGAMPFRHGNILLQIKALQQILSVHNLYKNEINGLEKNVNPRTIVDWIDMLECEGKK